MFLPRMASATGGSGNLNTVVSGTTTGGTALALTGVDLASLSCLCAITAATSTLTITCKFQVSQDNVTWYDLMGDAQNPANVIFATGTAAIKNAVLPVPPSVAGWAYVRPATVTGVTTGAAGDLYAFTFYFRRFNGFVGV